MWLMMKRMQAHTTFDESVTCGSHSSLHVVTHLQGTAGERCPGGWGTWGGAREMLPCLLDIFVRGLGKGGIGERPIYLSVAEVEH